MNAFVTGGMVPESMRGKTLDDYVHVADWCTLRENRPDAPLALLPPGPALTVAAYSSPGFFVRSHHCKAGWRGPHRQRARVPGCRRHGHGTLVFFFFMSFILSFLLFSLEA